MRSEKSGGPPGPRAGAPGRARLCLALVALPVLPLVLAGCGGKGTPTAKVHGTTKPSAVVSLSGLGATTTEWDGHHSQATTSSPGGLSYGPQVPFGSGQVEQFTAVKTAAGRISGFDMAFKDGTSIATAEEQIYALLPADARQTESRRSTFKGSTDICEMVTFESANLTTVLGAGHGTVGVTLFQVGTNNKGSPSIQVVDRATVTVPAPPKTALC